MVTSYIRCTETIKKAYISTDWMDLKHIIPEQLWKAKNIMKKDVHMKFYDSKETLYLEIDASEVNLRAGPLQKEKNKYCTTQLYFKTSSIC